MTAPTKDDDRCTDCNSDRATMHNSREVTVGHLWWRKTVTQRFPGFLCVKCWMAANPNVWFKR